jgi:hypothetical protein
MSRRDTWTCNLKNVPQNYVPIVGAYRKERPTEHFNNGQPLPGISLKTRVAASIRLISPGVGAALATTDPNRRKKPIETGAAKYLMASSFLFGL